MSLHGKRVQHNRGLSPNSILLTQCYYLRDAVEGLDAISFEGLDAFIFFFNSRRVKMVYNYERSELLLIDGDGKKSMQKNVRRTKKIVRRSSGVRLAYTDPFGERQRAPSTPGWSPSSLQRFFRRAIASSVHTRVFRRANNYFSKTTKKTGGLELTIRG